MIDLAVSPCPNDTFLFAPWILGKVGRPPAAVHFADIEQLNQWALQERYPLVKVSIATAAHLDEYELLPVGAALGFNVGPKVISRKQQTFHDLTKLKLAVPGEGTTAHLLLQRLCPKVKDVHFCLYHEIYELIKRGDVDAGVIIHESRFSFEKEGFFEVCDLGELWHQNTKLPLPLGGLVLRKGDPRREEVVSILQQSYDYATLNRKEILPFILKHAQEEAYADPHIKTYVTSETRELSSQGWEAIERLTDGKVTPLCPAS